MKLYFKKIKSIIQQHKLLKIFLILLVIVMLFVGIVILFISPITKYLIEKYDVKYTGRQIEMDLAYVNPFTGYIHLKNIQIYELNTDSIFFSADALNINVELRKIPSKTYEISDLTIKRPRGTIIQNNKEFNFNDLIEKFTSKDTTPVEKSPVHFNLLNVNIIDGEFYFRENSIPISYSIIKVNIETPGYQWNSDTIQSQFSFTSGIGKGDVKGAITVNLKNNDYKLAIGIHKFDLNIIAQYLKDLTSYGTFRATLDADLKSSGNFKSVDSVTTAGRLAISDFHFGKNPDEDYASFDKLTIVIKELSPKHKRYYYDSILMEKPFFKYEKYDYLDNLQRMFGQKGSKISEVKADDKFNLVLEIADFIKQLSKNFFSSHFTINSFAVKDADIKFNDFSQNEEFNIALNPFSITADSIDKNNKRVHVFLKSAIQPYGNMNIALSINPKDTSDFDLHVNVRKLPATLFNPYLITQSSFPLDRGTIELKAEWNVRNGNIKSDNQLLVIDPRLSKRLVNKNLRWLPMRIIMAFVRERGNVIDYQVPISGNLRDPKFHLRDVIFDVLKNIFVKPATTAYRMEVKTVETQIEKFLSVNWELRNSSPGSSEERFINEIVDFLEKNPDAKIKITPQVYTNKEKEYILFFEAKKKYFLTSLKKNSQSLSKEDSLQVEKMSIKDSAFVHYLDKLINDPLIFTIQEKCKRYIDSQIVNAKFKELNNDRQKVFLSYFKNNKAENQVSILSSESVIPYNGFSFYKIDYKGEFPESLLRAYRKMNDLNNAEPRRKFKKERKKSGGIF